MNQKSAGVLNKKITNQLNRFCSQSEIRLLGSNAIKGMLFPADVDTTCIVTGLDPDQLARHIQNAVSKLGDAFLTEFKITIGKTKHRWSEKDLLKGKKQGKTLSQALAMADGIVKADMIIPVNEGFIDATINYLVTFDGKTNIQPTSKKAKIEELRGEMNEYKKENLFKALKRKFSIMNLQGKNTTALLPFINSEVGLLSLCKTELDLLLELKKRKRKNLLPFVQVIKERLGRTTIPQELLFQMNTWSSKSLVSNAKKLLEVILAKMNEDTRTFLKVHKISL
jgi:hypothetical protein